MKKKINYFNYEERNGMFLLCFILVLFSTFIFLQKRILPEETNLTVVHNGEIQEQLLVQKDLKNFETNNPQESNFSNNNARSSKVDYKSKSYKKYPNNQYKKSNHFKQEYKNNNASISEAINNEHLVENDNSYPDNLTQDELKKQNENIIAFNDSGEVDSYSSRNKEKYQSKSKNPTTPFSINSRNIDEWKSLYGIGPKYAERIIKYQNWLGGFHSKSQLTEVYGITDSLLFTLEPFLIDAKPYKLIDINKAEVKELGGHPYLEYDQAKKITKYRKHHGEFKTFEDLEKVKGLDLEQLIRMKPYLLFDSDNLKTNEESLQKKTR